VRTADQKVESGSSSGYKAKRAPGVNWAAMQRREQQIIGSLETVLKTRIDEVRFVVLVPPVVNPNTNALGVLERARKTLRQFALPFFWQPL
jgi:hypothetical protein